MRRVVLAGAGHANIVALRILARHDIAAEITLVNDGPYAWYTGALPALVRGDVAPEAARIDLLKLTTACGAEFYNAPVSRFSAGQLFLETTRPLAFDILSLALGGVAAQGGVKPILAFLARMAVWQAQNAPRIGILGAGASGVELALALRIRLGGAARIFVAGGELLPGAPPRARTIAAQALERAGIGRGPALPAGLDDVIHAYTPAPEILSAPNLLIAGESHVFGTGDYARMSPPLPRSGAIAVRQGRVLAANIMRLLRGHSLKPFVPPSACLAIMSLDSERALAWYHGSTWHGVLPMRVKRYLDEKWVG
ncbi:MAG: FAD-dependent oxidoreductase [Acidocella sp.]|nr:FAD-dependent oxidoreductase [Acidocella sp.]